MDEKPLKKREKAKWRERRGGRRAKTERRAQFAPPGAAQPFRQGVAVDISPNGLRLLTKTPLEPGARVEIRVHPRPGGERGDIHSVSGRVVWRRPARDGQWLMGVWTPLAQSLAANAEPLASAAEARALLESIADGLYDAVRGKTPLTAIECSLPGEESAHGMDAETNAAAPAEYRADDADDSSETPLPAAGFRRYGCLAAALSGAMLAAILFAILLGIRGCAPRGNRPGAPESSSGSGIAARNSSTPDAPVESPSESPDAPPRKRSAAVPRRYANGPDAALLRTVGDAQGYLAGGDFNEAAMAFRAILTRPGLPPAARFAALLGEAQASHGLGDPGKALTALELALADTRHVPEEWIAAARDYRTLAASGVPQLLAAHVLQDAMALDKIAAPETGEGESSGELFIEAEPEPQAETAQHTQDNTQDNTQDQRENEPERNTAAAQETTRESASLSAPSSGTLKTPRINVDTKTFLLTVFDGENAIASFPVGLGYAAATPRGDFRIANKIENPDWFDRGRIVKSGDPENRLGAYWLGLGDASGPLSYGIHPTRELDSIGKNLSRGCIRMRPGDAAQVFHWCGAGTPVHIGP